MATKRITTLAVAAALMAGCASQEAGGSGTTLLIAMTAVANEPRPALTVLARQELSAAVHSDQADLRIVRSGTERPVVIDERDLRLRRGTQIEHDPGRRADLAARELERVAGVLSNGASNSAHLDLLTLLDHIARTPGRVTAVVISSGLQTSGPLAVDRLDWDHVGADSVTDQARSLGLVPDLRGKRVVFAGLGEVARPQDTLSPPLRNRLVDMWLKLCRAGGGDCVSDSDPAVGGPPLSTTPVPTVPVPQPPSIPAEPKAVNLPSDILFGPDSAVLLPTAEPLLARLAAAAPPGARVSLVGHTASVGPAESARELSRQRASAVRDGLIRLGVPAASITVDGVGYDQPLVADRDAAGALIPAAAQQNRTVTVSLR
ncbi:OmpA family protein [Actinokineospora sp.]|uniref:OmpA family protein n=1 Tax=Actinokineospora sp. TaxID=1872133 RepID=UPI003D6A73A8